MTRKEALQKEAKSYSCENPAISGNYSGGFYYDYCTPYQNFMSGAEYADKTMIDKACEWLMEIENGTTITNINDFVEDFRKAMEE